MGDNSSLIAILCASCFVAHAAGEQLQVDVIAQDRGWYNDQGFADDGGATPQPNYVAGVDRFNREFRNWFTFDLTSIEEEILAISINIIMPPGNPDHPVLSGGYRSQDLYEEYVLRGVDTDPDDLIGELGGLDAFHDLGTGEVFGSVNISEMDEGNLVTIDLGASAVQDAIHARSQSLLWAVGGSVPTISFDGLEEGVFAGSHSMSVDGVFLSITVPSPSSFVLFSLAGSIVATRRQRQLAQSCTPITRIDALV